MHPMLHRSAFVLAIITSSVGISGCSLAPTGPALGSSVALPASMRWTESTTLPPGAESVLLDGDPSAAAMFTVRLRIPADYRIPPHRHPAVERLTVLSGSIHLGYGTTFNRAASRELPAGSHVVSAAGVYHYSWTSEAAVVQITAMGPWRLEYFDDARAPRNMIRSTRNKPAQGLESYGRR